MWFKNICFYKLVETFSMKEASLQEKLLSFAARPCGKLERMTYGWSSPLNDGSDWLVQSINGVFLLAATKHEKILPTSVIREHVKDKVKEIKETHGRDVGKREQRSLFDEVTLTLLPQAFSKMTTTYGYIDLQKGWLIVDTGSRNRAEEFITLLRKSLGSFKLELPVFNQSLVMTMTDWLESQRMPSGLTPEDSCEMHDPQQSSVIRCVHQDVFSDEIINHLHAGKKITKMAYTWKDRITFVLESDFAVKRLRFLDVIHEENKDVDIESPEEQLAADATIFTAEFRELLDDLIACFGGFVDDNAPVDVPTAEVEFA